ncbi:hypothetical protein [Brachybacterium sacelli]|uniref:hypothetical protein n=1 Tax=Brachybacterium sacelli TaxID=173364 RepID=UPI0036200F49
MGGGPRGPRVGRRAAVAARSRATTWQDLAAHRWQDWYHQVREAALELSARHGPIAVGGLSMGGSLAPPWARTRSCEGVSQR